MFNLLLDYHIPGRLEFYMVRAESSTPTKFPTPTSIFLSQTPLLLQGFPLKKSAFRDCYSLSPNTHTHIRSISLPWKILRFICSNIISVFPRSSEGKISTNFALFPLASSSLFGIRCRWLSLSSASALMCDSKLANSSGEILVSGTMHCPYRSAR